MIKANELRLGNILKPSGYDGFVIVFHIDEDDRQRVNYVGVENYSPIPLTPEMLEKCGAKELPDWPDMFILVVSGEEFMIECDHGVIKQPIQAGDLDGWSHTLSFHCVFLHQLQNIIFALTGEELKIEL